MYRLRRTLHGLFAAIATLLPGRFRGHRGPVERALPRDPGRPTALDQRLAAAAAGQPAACSGVALLDDGPQALEARLGLADLAGRSLDVQCYIWRLDTAGRLALWRLLGAADRGVRVRLLLDDTAIIGSERVFATLDEHPNVDVRFFNPFRTRGGGTWFERGLELLFDFSRLNRRMHNKAWIADDGYAVIGGRNVGDEYYLLHEEINFRDLDLITAGPAAHAASLTFDRYWNSRWAVPARHLARRGEARLAALRRRLGEFAARQRRFPYPPAPTAELAAEVLGRCVPHMIWAPVEVLADAPEKIEAERASAIAERLIAETGRVEREILMAMAYLSLPERGLELMRGLAMRGVRVRLLTNSLATTDVVVAHAGYIGTRRRLLAAGAEVHELRQGAHGRPRRLRPPRHSRASLHWKTAVFDRCRVFAGSLNLDPRSIRHNTEIGLFVDSPELAAAVARRLEAAFEPRESWRVERRVREQQHGGRRRAVEELLWRGQHRDGTEELLRREPHAGFWRRALAALFARLPIEDLV